MSVVPHIRVLLVDDQEMVTESFTRALEAADDVEVVGVAVTVAEALAAAAELRPAVVVMDDRLLDGSGTAAVTGIIEQVPDATVLLLTTRGEPAARPDAVAAGRVGYLEKTSAFGSLTAAIRAVAHGEVVRASEDPARIGTGGDQRELRQDLTRRETEVLGLMAEGLSNQAIAERLTVSIHTVRTHVQTILRKLDAHSKLEAVAAATRLGFVSS